MVGQRIRSVHRLPFRQRPLGKGQEAVQVYSSLRRNRHNLGPGHRPAIGIDDRQQMGFVDRVNLIDEKEHRLATPFNDNSNLLDGKLVRRSGSSSRLDHHIEEVNLSNGLQCGPDHTPAQQMLRLMEARRIVKRHLRAREIQDTQHARPRGLRFVGHNRALLSQQCVQERRLPHIGTADNSNTS